MPHARVDDHLAAPTGDQSCFDCLNDVAGLQRPHLPVGRPVAFWLVSYLFGALMLGTTLPTPLYVIYQGQWHFSSGTITFIFASYAAGVLAALLFAGRSSDQVGRRWVLATALVLSSISTTVFILASSLGWLFVGRVLSGLAAGLTTGTATAALTETSSPSSPRRATMVATTANMLGLGLGPLVAGLFAEYEPRPTVLVFEVYLGLLALGAIALVLIPETVPYRQHLTLRFAGLGVPVEGRSEFMAAGVAGFAAFSLLGLFSALAPSFLGGVLHQHNYAISGAVVFAMFGTAALTQLVVGRFPSRPIMRFGLVTFLAGLALIVAGLSEASMTLFLTGTIIGGVAVGAVFIGSLSTANRLAPPQTRGRVVSTFFIFCYVGLAVPVVAVGVASDSFGDFRSVLACSIVLAVLCALSMAGIERPVSPKPNPRPAHS